ncbi:ferric uptake regulator family protein [Methanobrevibacter cuticularis]|uniref:Ferric uptake regulator family protein n=1 Tax=Methanobrevibacter cuticularis TaxID=47311 RepID=A0A166CHE5_9EURY|nr:ATP-binding protein [Methanobrevibacter cuticularis]KZX14510.1 ferric uptake regulator family protein [Methanobrevibacter cuticularis]
MIKREMYLSRIEPYIDKNIVKVISGIRRCGKSTILQQIIDSLKQKGVKEENIILINFELKEYFNIKNIDKLDNLIEKLIKNTDKNYLFFDEIQEVENWEKLINSYLAEKKYDIFITGSNAKLLSGELATYLTGRYIEIKIYPFSFLEFIDYKKSNKKIGHEKSKENRNYKKFSGNKLFIDYLRFGGMPSVLEFETNEKIQYLTDLYNSIFLKDIIKRNEIRDVDLLERILLFIMANIGQLFSANNIVKYLKKDKINVSVNTIYNYLSYMEEACLINKLKREDLVGKKILNHKEKFYLTDLGFRQAVYGDNEKDIDQSIENIVYTELLRRGYNITIGKFKEKEVDFVCKKAGETIYIQVSYILADETTVKREFESLLKIQDNYPKYVISMDEFDFSREGIKHINLIDFLKGNMI